MRQSAVASEAERILDQLKWAFEGEAWHGPSVREALVGVTAEVAASKPLANVHSIWEIVLHIAAWERASRRRLEGEEAKLSPEEDWPQVKDTSEQAWRSALSELASEHQQLCEVISRLNDSELNDTVTGQSYSIYFMLHGVIQHNLYHAGQLTLLKKGL